MVPLHPPKENCIANLALPSTFKIACPCANATGDFVFSVACRPSIALSTLFSKSGRPSGRNPACAWESLSGLSKGRIPARGTSYSRHGRNTMSSPRYSQQDHPLPLCKPLLPRLQPCTDAAAPFSRRISLLKRRVKDDIPCRVPRVSPMVGLERKPGSSKRAPLPQFQYGGFF